jgi:hypothetical protein
MRRNWLLFCAFFAFLVSMAGAQQTAPPQQSPPADQGVPAQSAPVTSPQTTAGPPPTNQQCIDCHGKSKPQIVTEWKQSKHSQVNVGCIDCHGAAHASASDVDKVKIARPNVCAHCHQPQVDQDRHGKHSQALVAIKTMFNAHWREMRSQGSMMPSAGQGCVDCHRTGSPDTKNEITFEKFGGVEGGALEWGAGACSSCHSRHSFSVEEARQPQACQYCHIGADNDQHGMYETSRHGILFDLKQRGLLPANASVPTCQTCHMPKGDHAVLTSWGYRGLSLPLPADKQWAADRTAILKGLNFLGEKGEDNPSMETAKAYMVMRFSQEDWQKERDKMTAVCVQCHSEKFSKDQLQAGDDAVRTSDHLVAEAMRVISGLYEGGILPPPAKDRPYPWLISFDPPKTIIEQRLETMFFEHRMHYFQGAFHSSPKYSIEDGLAKLRDDLTAITEMAASLKANPTKSRQLHAPTKGAPVHPKTE